MATSPVGPDSTRTSAKSTNPLADAFGDRGRPLVWLGAFVAVLWVIQVIDTVASHRLVRYGIRPRRLSGLKGIVFAPFLHVGFRHLVANTIPLIVLGTAGIISAHRKFAVASAIITLVGGVGVWLTASSNSVHVGASGLVFGWAAYLITRGAFNRRIGQLVLGAVVGIAYGSMFFGVLPTRPGVSWQGHLFGSLGGVLAGFAERRLNIDRPT